MAIMLWDMISEAKEDECGGLVADVLLSCSRWEARGCGPRLGGIILEKSSIFVDSLMRLLRMIKRNVGGG
jgi:hypothetical protein